jgi:3-oxoacyl-[acyl-carrier protein] reductase
VYRTQQEQARRRLPGRPEDVAATVRFLYGLGGRYINWQAIRANGGAYLGA